MLPTALKAHSASFLSMADQVPLACCNQSSKAVLQLPSASPFRLVLPCASLGTRLSKARLSSVRPTTMAIGDIRWSDRCAMAWSLAVALSDGVGSYRSGLGFVGCYASFFPEDAPDEDDDNENEYEGDHNDAVGDFLAEDVPPPPNPQPAIVSEVYSSPADHPPPWSLGNPHKTWCNNTLRSLGHTPSIVTGSCSLSLRGILSLLQPDKVAWLPLSSKKRFTEKKRAKPAMIGVVELDFPIDDG